MMFEAGAPRGVAAPPCGMIAVKWLFWLEYAAEEEADGVGDVEEKSSHESCDKERRPAARNL